MDNKNINEVPVVEETTVKSKSNLVTIDKDILENLLNRVEKMEDKLVAPTPSKRVVKNKEVKVRKLNDQFVVGYGKTFEKKDVTGRKYLVIEVYTQDGKKHEEEFVQFNELGDYVTGEVIGTKIDESRSGETITGSVNATVYDYDKYSSHQTEKEVPLVVTFTNYIFTIKLPDGQTIDLPDNAVN